MLNIRAISALTDNYIWLIEQDKQLIIVDPSEASTLLELIAQQSLSPVAILITHNHSDHTSGVAELLDRFPHIKVYAPEEVTENVTNYVQGQDQFALAGLHIEVLTSAGHTAGHISYLIDEKYLFCGDALFSAGCGRVFTGDYQAQFEALVRFNQLSDEVVVFPAHEYTLANLKFAQVVMPTNCAVSEYLKWAEFQRAQQKPTLPTTIKREKQINPFLRAKTLAEFITLREKKDTF